MTNCPDDTPMADDIPAADAAEQHQPADDCAEDAGLDPRVVWLTFCSATPTRRM